MLLRIRFPLSLVTVTFLFAGVSLANGQTGRRSDSRRLKTVFPRQPAAFYNQDASRPAGVRGEPPALPYYEKEAWRPVIDTVPPIGEVQIHDLALPSPTPIVLPSPVPTPTPNPTPNPTSTPAASASPSPTVAPTETPIPSPSIPPPPTPPPASTPAFPVPAPNPAPMVRLALRPPPAPPSGAPSLLYVQSLTPVVEVWRSGALVPEVPVRRGRYLNPIGIAAAETITVRLQFGMQARGKRVTSHASAGVAVNPPQQTFVLSPAAQIVVALSLGQDYSRGDISFYCEGIHTTLIVGRVAPIAATQQSGVASMGASR